LIAFPRPACAQLLVDMRAEVAAGKTPELVAAADSETGIVLQSAASHASAIAEELDFNAAPVDPLLGWSYERAIKRKAVGLVCGTVAAAVPLAALAEALETSTEPNPVFFAVVDETPLPEQHSSGGGCGGGGCGGCGCQSRHEITAFSLRPVAYPRLSDTEYARAREPDAAEWPPAPAPGLAGGLVRGGFVVDQVAYACEQIRHEEFLYTSKKPVVGLGVFLQLALLPDGFARMYGKVTKVGPLPEPGAAADPVVGESYFKTCTCGREHKREELFGELGTLHGQRVEATVYVTPERVDAKRTLAGQWHVVLVADDRKQALWQLEAMTPLPREAWIPFIARS